MPADTTTLLNGSPGGSKRTMPSPIQVQRMPFVSVPSLSAGRLPSITNCRKSASMASSAQEVIDRAQAENARQHVECGARFCEQSGIGEIFRCKAVAIMLIDPRVEFREQRIVNPDARIHRSKLRLVQYHAQPKARGTAAILHAFAQVEDEDFIDGSRTILQGIEVLRHPRVLAAFLRHDEHLPAIGRVQQLAVE